MIRPLRILVSAVAAMSIFGAAASPASAGLLVASAPSCEAQSLSQPFLPWVDPMHYVIAPNGDFESGSWRTTGDAAVVQGNEPWNVGGADHHKSLALRAGSSARSATMCVGLEHPTVRFFARQTAGSLVGARVNVDVHFEDSTGDVQTLRIASTDVGSRWNPTLPFPIVANLLPLLPGEQTPVAFSVSASGGDFQIDDFYVDPTNRG